MAYTSKQTARETQAAEESVAKQTTPAFSDQRASTSVQLKQQQMMNTAQGAPLQRAEDEELLQGKFETAQLAEEEELLQGKFATTQLMEEEEPLQGKFETAQLAEEEELIQGKFSNTATAQLEQKPNNTGLPNQLKAGIESLSGMSMDNVKVHYNSDKPAQLNAHAYAQGTDIHVAPGQEQHLPHEAWHVVQQAQGRVQPTTQMKGTSVNDDVGLEAEADVMGAKALSSVNGSSQTQSVNSINQKNINSSSQYNSYAQVESKVIQQAKEEHGVGDLHYGIHQPRVDGLNAMNVEDPLATPTPAQDPLTVDELNRLSNVTSTFTRGNSTNNFMAGYFDVIQMLTTRPNPVVASPIKSERWLDFLKENIDYLKIDKQIAQIGSLNSTNAPPTKDRLNKNGATPDAIAGQTINGKRQAILAAFAARTSILPAHADYEGIIDSWVWDVFFRRTSKLGIKFTVAEGKVVHFNNDSPGNPTKGRPDTTVSNAAETPVRGRQPITHSEMRYINRTALIDSNNVDVYRNAADVNDPRTGDEGQMLDYQIDKILDGNYPKPL